MTTIEPTCCYRRDFWCVCPDNNTGATIDSNDNWQDHSSANLTSEALSELGQTIDDLDAAMVLDLAAGSYTLIVEGVGETTGTALGGVAKTNVTRAGLSNTSAQCEALGIDRFCTPSQTEAVLDQVFIVNPGSGDELFTITADPTTIMLTFDEGVSSDDLAGTGFFLRDLQNTENLPIRIADIDFFGEFVGDAPLSDPIVTNFRGGDGINRTEIEWSSLEGLNPVGADAAIGINLAFVSEPSDPEPTLDLVNESTRGFVGTGDDRMIIGFIAEGSGTQRYLLFGVGPTLEDSGLSGVLPDPKITLVNNNTGATIDSNDNWQDHSSANLTSEALSELGQTIDDLDAAMVLDLAAGSYTLIVEGVGETTGTALGGVAKTSAGVE